MFQRPQRAKAVTFTLRKGQGLLIGNNHRLYFNWNKSVDAYAVGVRGKADSPYCRISIGDEINLEDDLAYRVEFAKGSGDRLKVVVLEGIRYPVSVIGG